MNVDLNLGIIPARLRALVEAALDEDLGGGDLTSDYFIPAEVQAIGDFVARQPGVLVGIEVAAAVYAVTSPEVKFEPLLRDGTVLNSGVKIARVFGPARMLLRGERVALNFMQRLSGIASLTARYVEAVQGTQVRIVDTRKTTPGLRDLEKYAVRAGGGFNHRRDLSDGVMIKDNHVEALAAAGINLSTALQTARRALPHLVKIEVEVDRLDQIAAALEGGADVILLDNMSLDQLREAVAMIGSRALTEASGGVNLTTVGAIAATGVNMISVGALTHSAPALDIGLDFEIQPLKNLV
jgi:nicotinate-nucleotide pyrophosphorylase (carboxylating)